jgi:Ca2+-binding RTX toxin-like protein
MAEIRGTWGDDSLVGTDDNDTFRLSEGNDTLDGLGGSDWLLADADFIEVDLGAGTAVFDGFTQVLRNIENVDLQGTDVHLTGSDRDNRLFVRADNATILGGAGNDHLRLNTTSRSNGDSLVQGDAGNDYISINGSEGANVTVSGGSGDDVILVEGSGTTATVSGGSGDDMLRFLFPLLYTSVEPIAGGLRLSSFFDTTVDVMDDVEFFQFRGSTVPDPGYTYAETLALAPNLITGTDGDDTLYGTSGNDRIEALGGNDLILPGGVGNDTVDGGDGQDMLSFAGHGSGISVSQIPTRPTGTILTRIYTAQGITHTSNIEAITGTSHGDEFRGWYGVNHYFRGLGGADWFNGGDGADYFDGGAGSDWLLFDQEGRMYPDVYVSLLRGRGWTGDAAGVRFTNVENIRSGDGNDRLDGDHGANRLEGGSGDDTLTGLGGDDMLYGGDGADYINGGAGSDTLLFDQQSPASPGVYVSLLRGRGWTGEAAGDRFTGIENILSGHGNDRLDGDHSSNRLEGNHGDDTLTGLGGNDVLYGGNGTDVAVYFGNRADYDIQHNGWRTEVTHLNNGWEGHDILAHVEILRFADGDLIL